MNDIGHLVKILLETISFRGVDYKQIYVRGKWLHHSKNQLFVGLNFTYNSFNEIVFQEGDLSLNSSSRRLERKVKSLGIGPTDYD
ncbi:MAG: hypothetical protein V9E96_10760 [Chitinophagaceae bacterium]